MATTFKGDGSVIDYTAGSAISSGDVVVMGEIVGVALTDIANGAIGAVQVEGVFTLACKGTDVVAIGDPLYWDAGNSELTLTKSTHKTAGFAAGASANGATTVDLKLNGFTDLGA